VVLNSNKNVNSLLGYTQKEIVGKNVTKIMPKIYADMHGTFMLNFLKRGDSDIVEK